MCLSSMEALSNSDQPCGLRPAPNIGMHPTAKQLGCHVNLAVAALDARRVMLGASRIPRGG